jgi:hypothetical protein
MWAIVWLGAAVSAAAPDARASGYVAPSRRVDDVAYAIGRSRPDFAPLRRQRLASLLIAVAREHNFDALTGWAIIDHESRWRADAVGPDGEDIGLAQIRYTQSRACRAERDSDACRARRAALMDPAVNIRAMGGAIRAWRELCEERTGIAPDMRHWLAGYGGYSRPARQILCGRERVRTARGWRWRELPTPKAVADIVSARKAMIIELHPVRRKGRPPGPKPRR